MMEHIRQWLCSVVAVSLLVSVVQSLVPKGSLRRVSSFLSGLVLLAVLLGPLPELDLAGLELGNLQEETREIRQKMEAEEETALKAGIAERTEAYISDKANALGQPLQVRVKTEVDEEGIPVPSLVELEGPFLPELSDWLAQEIGLGAERQVWNGGKN